MSLTLRELKDKLAERYDPELLLEMLEISSEDIVEAFEDKILARFDNLQDEVSDEV